MSQAAGGGGPKRPDSPPGRLGLVLGTTEPVLHCEGIAEAGLGGGQPGADQLLVEHPVAHPHVGQKPPVLVDPLPVELEPDHPLLAGFKGQSFVHMDEPYLFKNADFDYDFRPLLSMDATALHSLKEEIKDPVIYISWVKRYGKGRVFYVSPSHNAQSFEKPGLLKFYLDGLQYVTGDLTCDDSPMKRKS